MSPDAPAVSYRALLAIPDLGRVVASMQLARIAGAMVGVALVLFTLLEYDSPPLAGLVTLASILPGLIISPIAGALLDRHGRVRLVQLDYLIAAASLVLIGGLSLAGLLEPWLLLVIAAVSSLTGPLSATGLRSLFPIMVPRHLWERVNAVDSNGYVIATIVGPPLAAIMVSALGPAVGLILIALPLVAASLMLIGVREPHTETASTGRLLLDAWQGLAYVARNPTLRGLGVSISLNNLANGAISIIVPLLVLDQLGGSELAVGVAFAASGVAGMASALWFGRQDTRGREWRMLWTSMAGMSVTALLLLPGAGGMVPGVLGGLRAGAGRDGRLGRDERAAGHRAVHAPPAAHGSGLAGPRVRGLDGRELRGLPHRCGAGGRAGRDLAGGRAGPGAGGHRRIVGVERPARAAHRRGRPTRRAAAAVHGLREAGRAA